MSRCSDKGCGGFFTERVAARDARKYRKKGLDRAGRRIVSFLRGQIAGRTILEVGGGIGAIQLELLKAGGDRAVNVELSPAYESEAEALLREAGLEARVERRVGDFAERAEELHSADTVVLHRVVCCYPDYEALLGAAAGRTRHALVFSYPKRTWWSRLGVTLVNTVQRLRRNDFRSFVHPPAAMAASIERRGLRPVEDSAGMFWCVAAFVRG